MASPKRELRVFTAEEDATEHIGLDHLPHVSTFIADWVADTFAERRSGHRSLGSSVTGTGDSEIRPEIPMQPGSVPIQSGGRHEIGRVRR